jgi:hypothetical protein
MEKRVGRLSNFWVGPNAEAREAKFQRVFSNWCEVEVWANH